jgi:hypothetical protein
MCRPRASSRATKAFVGEKGADHQKHPWRARYSTAESSRPSHSVLMNRRDGEARRAFRKSNKAFILTRRLSTVGASKRPR